MTSEEQYKKDLKVYADCHILCGNDINKLLEENMILERALDLLSNKYADEHIALRPESVYKRYIEQAKEQLNHA